MKWLILFIVTTSDPFVVKTLEFESGNECTEYVNNPNNASRLAIEVIDVAGFNAKIESIMCLPENKVKEYLDVGSSMVST